VCEVEEKESNTCALALPGVAWRGGESRVHDVCVNSPLKSGPKPHRSRSPFAVYFFTSMCLIHFDRDRLSRLQDAVTLDRSSL
jgi:hypothetical protein